MEKFKELPIYELELSTENLGVFAISFVENPASKSNFIYFEEDSKVVNFAIESEDERIALGVILPADTPIYRKGIEGKLPPHYVKLSEDTIKETVLRFAKGKYLDSVTLAHKESVEGVYLIENWIVGGTIQMGLEEFKDVPVGSWMGKFYIENDEVWEEIKKGTFQGFSIEGEFAYKGVTDNKNLTDLDAYELIYKFLHKLK